MSSQVISYRLSDEEVAALRRQALPGESDNQTAQRLARQSLGVSTVSTVSTMSLPVDGLEERIESIVEKRFESFALRLQERLQEEVKTEVKKLSSQIDARANLADVDTVDNYPESVDRLQKERDELDARNLELEADLKNVVALKDEEIEQLRSTQNKPPEEQKPDYQSVADHVLSALKLGTQSPQYKIAKKALIAFIKQLSASPTD